MSLRILTSVALFLSASVAFAQPVLNPLRFVPAQTELVVIVDRPQTLVETVEKHELFQDAIKLPGVREYFDTASYQHVKQLIGYFEKQLGKNRNELVDELASGGIVLGAKLTPPQGAIVVIQARDEKRLKQFVDVALDVLKQELERKESKDRIVRAKIHEIDTVKIGPKVCFAVVDSALIIASEDKLLKDALETQTKQKDAKSVLQLSNFTDARKQAPGEALIWAWLNLDELRKNPDFKNGLEAVALDPVQTVLFGGLTNLIKRSPYVALAATRETGYYRLRLSMPKGTNGMGELKHMMVPPDLVGTAPPLLTPRLISTSSYTLDLGQFWEKRVEILGEKNSLELEKAEKELGKFLGSIKLSKLFKSMGPNQRVVVAQQKEHVYKIRPATPFPAFALVVEMRDPSFARDMNTILRSGALVATVKFGLKLNEETYRDCEMISYHFLETKKVEDDPQNVRFNFTPTYVTVGNHFVVSATAELARDLIDALKAEEKQPFKAPSKASAQTRVFAAGLSEFVRANEDAALTQLILAQAMPPKTAKEEFRAIHRWIERLGELRVETHYGRDDFRFDFIWQPKAK